MNPVQKRQKKFENAIKIVKKAVILVLYQNTNQPLSFQELHGNISCGGNVLYQALAELRKKKVIKKSFVVRGKRLERWKLTKKSIETVKRL